MDTARWHVEAIDDQERAFPLIDVERLPRHSQFQEANSADERLAAARQVRRVVSTVRKVRRLVAAQGTASLLHEK